MQSKQLIPVHELCIHYQIEQSFIFSLKEAGLIEVITVEETICVPLNQLPQLEKMIRLYEMDINPEGIETITHLLNRIQEMQKEILMLQNRLNRYES
ncbi:MAG TPA: chaperone modulator CbpM [Chitinophagaceae bacterium]|nr:chaperone modulator CbpM [Chitinophagaceae bacterium]